MSIDQHIKSELENESAEIDRILATDNGISSMLAGGLRGGLRRWFLVANLAAIMISVALVFCGYQFVVASTTESSIFWGILMVLALQMQIGVKQWIWQEMSRNSMMREIKRVELSVSRLDDKLSKYAD